MRDSSSCRTTYSFTLSLHIIIVIICNVINQSTVVYSLSLINNKKINIPASKKSQKIVVIDPIQLKTTTPPLINRRNLLLTTATASTSILIPTIFLPPSASIASASPTTTTKTPPLLKLPNCPNVKIPRVGYSVYKTDKSQIIQCLNLALNSGVRHFDVGTLYGTNEIVGNILDDFIQGGVPEIDAKGYNIEEGSSTGQKKRVDVASNIKQQKRRKELFISHKISNQEQSANTSIVQNNIKKEIQKLCCGSYLDMVSIHSPLTDKDRRLGTYRALVDLKEEGIIRSFGVCNYGIGPLDEIIKAGLPPPSVIQLQLSPFNQHKDIAQWADKHGSSLSCAAWSKLSGVDGPQDGWTALSEIAKKKGMTKSQVLVQWSMQHGFISVPRSGAGSKLERKAIYENSYEGVNSNNNFFLREDEMQILDGLDERLMSGRLGVIDGWNQEDITGPNWDPTTIIV